LSAFVESLPLTSEPNEIDHVLVLIQRWSQQSPKGDEVDPSGFKKIVTAVIRGLIKTILVVSDLHLLAPIRRRVTLFLLKLQVCLFCFCSCLACAETWMQIQTSHKDEYQAVASSLDAKQLSILKSNFDLVAPPVSRSSSSKNLSSKPAA